MAKIRSAGDTNLFKWAGFGGRGRTIPWIPRPAPPFKWLPKAQSQYKVSWVPSVPSPYAPVEPYEPYFVTRRFDDRLPGNFLMKFSRNEIGGEAARRNNKAPVSYEFSQPNYKSASDFAPFSKNENLPVRQNSKLSSVGLPNLSSKKVAMTFMESPSQKYPSDNKFTEHSSKIDLEPKEILTAPKLHLVEAPKTKTFSPPPVKQRHSSKLLRSDDVIYFDRGNVGTSSENEFPDYDTSVEEEDNFNFVVSEKFTFADQASLPSPTKRSEGSRGFWKSKILPVPLFSKSDLSRFPLFS